VRIVYPLLFYVLYSRLSNPLFYIHLNGFSALNVNMIDNNIFSAPHQGHQGRMRAQTRM